MVGIKLLEGNLTFGVFLIIIGIIGIVITLLSRRIYKFWKLVSAKLHDYFKVVSRLKEANNLLVIKDEQKGNESNYLHPVLQSIEACHDDSYNSNLAVKFQLVSCLLYAFKPQQMWIMPSINGCDILDNGQRFEIEPIPNLLSLQYSQIISKAVPIQKDWVRKEIEDAKRTGAKINSQLRIEIETKDGIQVLK